MKRNNSKTLTSRHLISQFAAVVLKSVLPSRLAVRFRRKRKPWLTAAFLIAFAGALNSRPARASVVEFSSGPSTTTANSEIFFSPLSGEVSDAYFANATFGVGNVAGNQAIAFNLIDDGNFVISPDPAGPSISSVARLGSGVLIGSESSFDNTELTLADTTGSLGNWNQFGAGFIGLEFGTGRDAQYSWADIKVDSDYNVTLNSFAYDTVAGEAIRTPAAAAPEPSSIMLFGLSALGAVLFGAIRKRRIALVAVAAALPLLLAGAASTLSAQTIPGQTDPAAGRLMQFRSDQLFNISAAAAGQTNWSTFDASIGDSPFNAAVQDTSYSTTTGWSAGRQYHTASGRFLTPEHDDVVVVYGDGSNVQVQVVGHPELSTTLPGLLSRYVQTLADGSTHPSADWISVAADDLDGDADASGNYHDEVVVAYVMTDGTYRVAVLEFSASVINPDTNQLQTYPPAVFTFNAMNGVKYSPAIMVGPEPCQCASVLPDNNLISVAVGNFDGNTDGEIALTAVTDSSGQTIQTLRFRPEMGEIFPISTLKIPTPDAVPGLKSATGADVESAAGDFEGRGASDLAVASMQWTYVPNASAIVQVDHAVSILKSSLQSTNLSNVSVYPGNPTTLWFNDDPAALAQVPKQLTISGATGTWSRLNGTWPTTMALISPDGVLHTGIQIPVDTTDLAGPDGRGSVAVSMTVGLSTGLAATSNTPLFRVPFGAPTPAVAFNHPESYPRMRLFSGLFKYDPAHSFDFSRRQLGVVWNAAQGTLSTSWFSVTDDAVGNPQVTQDGTQTIDAPGIQHSFDATAGAFRGSALLLNSDKTASGPATWPIIINTWYGNSQQILYAVDAGASGEVVTAQTSSTSQPYDPQERFSLVNYDADGKSTYLGAPVHISTSAFYTPTLILQEPPKHSAWLNGAIVNYSRNDSLNVQFQSSQGEQLTGSTQSQSSNTTTSLTTISAGLVIKQAFPFGIADKVSLQDTYKLGSDVEDTSSYYKSNSSTISYSQMAETDHDDFLRGQTQDLNVWRYRVYGANGESTTGYLYYDMSLPSAPYDSSASGLDLDWYNPIHENGNLLSYPSRPTSGLPDDVGGAYTVNNQVPPNVSNGVLFSNTGWCYGDDSGTETITMSGVTSSTDTVGWNKTNSWDNDASVSDTLSMEGVFKATGSFDSDWGQKQSLSTTTSSNNTMSGSASVTLNLGNGDATQDYNIFPVLYSSNAGVLKLIHYVNIPTAASQGTCTTSGQPFWTKYYAGAPDPALNLPYRFVFASYNKSTTTTNWNLQTGLVREKLRGFFVTSATPNPIESTDDNPVYDPVSINPTVGSTVRLAVRVYNYSVNQATGNINVNFWAVPYDSSKDNELACGTPGATETGRYCAPNVRTPLGTVSIASIPAWGGENWTLAAINWQIPSNFITQFNTPEFRIYVTVDYSGASLNPAQAPCNNSPADAPLPCPGSMITDTTNPNYDPKAPGQNKEGYGQITLQVNALQSTAPGHAPTYTKVHAVADSLAAIGPNDKLTKDVVVAYLGRPMRLRVKAVADNSNDPNQQKALVFDGSGKKRKLIAGKTLQGVSTKGTHAWFDWTPTNLGLHQLSAEFLGLNTDKGGADTKAKLSVVVVRLPGDVNGDGIVDARDTELVRQEIGKSVKESSCGSACDLNGNGVIDRGDLDLVTMHCDRNYCAATPVVESGKAMAAAGKKKGD